MLVLEIDMRNAPKGGGLVRDGIQKCSGDEGHRGGSEGCRDDDCLGFLCIDNGQRWGHQLIRWV